MSCCVVPHTHPDVGGTTVAPTDKGPVPAERTCSWRRQAENVTHECTCNVGEVCWGQPQGARSGIRGGGGILGRVLGKARVSGVVGSMGVRGTDGGRQRGSQCEGAGRAAGASPLHARKSEGPLCPTPRGLPGPGRHSADVPVTAAGVGGQQTRARGSWEEGQRAPRKPPRGLPVLPPV